MSEPNSSPPDWTHLPADTETRCLWASLHDGELLSCVSDLVDRTVTLTIQVSHLTPNEPDSSFEFLLRNVTSTRATVTVRWPGEFSLPPGIPRDEQSRLIDDYHRKWRVQSIGWNELEAAFRSNRLYIQNAELATGIQGSTLLLQGMLNGETIDDLNCEVFISLNGLSITTPSGQALSLDGFDLLGKDYWDAFSSRV